VLDSITEKQRKKTKLEKMLKLAILAVLACAVQGRDVSEKHCVRLFFIFKKRAG